MSNLPVGAIIPSWSHHGLHHTKAGHFLQVGTPEAEAAIQVDPITGEVLRHGKPKPLDKPKKPSADTSASDKVTSDVANPVLPLAAQAPPPAPAAPSANPVLPPTAQTPATTAADHASTRVSQRIEANPALPLVSTVSVATFNPLNIQIGTYIPITVESELCRHPHTQRRCFAIRYQVAKEDGEPVYAKAVFSIDQRLVLDIYYEDADVVLRQGRRLPYYYTGYRSGPDGTVRIPINGELFVIVNPVTGEVMGDEYDVPDPYAMIDEEYDEAWEEYDKAIAKAKASPNSHESTSSYDSSGLDYLYEDDNESDSQETKDRRAMPPRHQNPRRCTIVLATNPQAHNHLHK